MTKAKKQTPIRRLPNTPKKRERPRFKLTADARALGDRIQRLVNESYSSSVSAFARALGVQTSQVSNWQAGKNEPGAKHLRRIAELTTVSLDWLILGIGGDAPRYTTETRPTASFLDEFSGYVARRAAPLVGEALGMSVSADTLRVDATRILDDIIEKEARICAESRDRESRATELAAAISGTMLEIMELGAEHSRHLSNAQQRATGRAIGHRLLRNARAMDAFRAGDFRLGAIHFPHPATVGLPIFNSAVHRDDGMKMFLGQSSETIPFLEGLDQGSESLVIPPLKFVIETLKRANTIKSKRGRGAMRGSQEVGAATRKGAS